MSLTVDFPESVKTQDEWIAEYNRAGKIMAAAPDLYAAIKELDDAGIVSLREDFNNRLCLSTRIQYNSENLEGRITHYHGSTVTDPIEEPSIVIPIFRNTPIQEAIYTGPGAEQGLTYLQTYFCTQDSPQKIIQNLERVSCKPKEQIKIWTPNPKGQWSRETHPNRAAFVGFSDDGFYVDGYDFVDYYSGRSRGVAPEAPHVLTLEHAVEHIYSGLAPFIFEISPEQARDVLRRSLEPVLKTHDARYRETVINKSLETARKYFSNDVVNAFESDLRGVKV